MKSDAVRSFEIACEIARVATLSMAFSSTDEKPEKQFVGVIALLLL